MRRTLFGIECPRKFFLAVAVLLTAPVLWAAPAKATLISIGLQEDGGAISTVSTDSGSGNAFFSGSFGTYVVNNVSGTGSPTLPQPQLLTNSTNVTAGSGNHVLNVFITEQGLSSPTGITQFLSRLTSSLFSGAVTSVVQTTFLSTSNALYAGTQLSTATFTGSGSVLGSDNSPSLAPLYSETAEYTITTSGAGNFIGAIVISTPEPASLVLLGIGLIGTLAFARRRTG